MKKYEIINHLLFVDGVQVSFDRTPNGGDPINVCGIVNHHTASGDGSATGDISWLTQRRARASAHFVVDYVGKITQLMECNRKTWHAGKSKWKGKYNLNKYTIGVEIDNPGHLSKRVDGMFDGIGGPYAAALVVDTGRTKSHGNLRYWKRFSNQQIEAVVALNLALADEYVIDPEWIVTHQQIAPRRKTDPGPHFPLAKIQGLVRGNKDAGSKTKTAHPRHTAFIVPVKDEDDIKSYDDDSVIRKGERGEGVKIIQRGLLKLGFQVQVDGIFGEFTEDAVMIFQKRNSLTPDGLVGPFTFKKLANAEPLPKNVKPITKIITDSKTAKIAMSVKAGGIVTATLGLLPTNLNDAVDKVSKLNELKELTIVEALVGFLRSHALIVIGVVLVVIGGYLLYNRIQDTRNRRKL